VVRSVSLSFPQDVPERAFRTLFLLRTFSLMVAAWALPVRRGSRVTPRIVGFFFVGTYLCMSTVDGGCWSLTDDSRPNSVGQNTYSF